MQVIRSSLSLKNIALLILGLLTIFGGIAIFSDGNKILQVLQQAHWGWLPIAVIFMVLSYFLTSYSFARVNRMLGIPINTRRLTEIGFTTTALNHLFTTGGLAGNSLRYLLMKGPGVGIKDVITTSVIHFYLTSLIMLGMLPLGLIYFILHASVPPGTAIIISIVTFLAVTFFVVGSILFFVPEKRKPIMRAISRLTHRIFKKDVEAEIDQINNSFTRGVSELRSQPQKTFRILGLIFGDWLMSAAALWFCFYALGYLLNFGDLIAGFVIGIVSGVLSMIPGGLGIQEGSMAGIFTLLGSTFEQAILASILFRVVYYILPYIVSLVLTYWLLHTKEDREVVPEVEG
ncbi:MAG: flippase-like domain-containing protein [Anaerolineales bacterium]|jgi:hypothetical protein